MAKAAERAPRRDDWAAVRTQYVTGRFSLSIEPDPDEAVHAARRKRLRELEKVQITLEQTRKYRRR